jgi:hypothetical protein
MKRRRVCHSLIAGCLCTLCVLSFGCQPKSNKPRLTNVVAPPPRELIEKSYNNAKVSPPRPGAPMPKTPPAR